MRLLILILLFPGFCFSQNNITLTIKSDFLKEDRVVDVYIPASYENDSTQYSVIYTLDGDYTKFALNGIVEYYSYFEKIPKCIVVSIHQNYNDTIGERYKRWSDCDYSVETGELETSGERFKNFIEKELVPQIETTYRISKFRTIVGHSFTANYINYF